MIPKIVHYCWLSDDPYPQKIRTCMDSWQRMLPDHEFRLWNFDRFPEDKSPWVSQAFDAGKYAFAADYIRNYALYTEGGIYLDTDVEVLKSFDPLLHLPYFFGAESTTGDIEAAVMGSEAGNPVFKAMLDYYDSHTFVNPDGTMNTTPLPSVMKDRLSGAYTLHHISEPDGFIYDPNMICILPSAYFSPINFLTLKRECTPETMAIHHYAASWLPKSHHLKQRFKRLVGPRGAAFLVAVKRMFRKS